MNDSEIAGISGAEMPAPRAFAVLRLISAIVMFLMMSVTFVDVIGRYLLSLPLPGSSEITQVLMAGVIALAIPMVSAHRQHVKMALFENAIRGLAKRVLSIGTYFGSACVLVLMAILLWQQGDTLHAMRSTTIFLQLPLAPSAYVLSIFTGITAAIELWYCWIALSSARPVK